MHILDLVLQGVRRFGESRKFPLKPGLNVIFGPTATGKTTLLLCLLDLLFPDRLKEGEPSLISRDPIGASRAGLTLAAGPEVYRILKDFHTGQTALSQFNRASQKFEPVSSDQASIAGLLRSAFDLPPYDIYSYLFAATAEQMPSVLPLSFSDEAPPVSLRADEMDASGTINLGVKPSGRTAPPGSPPPGPTPAGFHPPGALPPGMTPPGMAPPGFTPPGMTPPGVIPPGIPPPPTPPGGMPPGITPPGMMPPGMMPPGMMSPGMMSPGISGPGIPGGMMGEMMAPGLMGGAIHPDLDDGMTPEEREQKLKQLRRELVDAQKVDHIQYEIDGLQQKVFEIEAKKKNATQFDQFLKEAKEQLERYPCFHRLPERVDERLDRYGTLDAQRAQELEKIAEKERQVDEKLAILRTFPVFYKQKLSMIGGGLLAAGILLFILLSGQEGIIKYAGALAAVGGVVVLAVNGFQEISRMTQRAELEEELAKFEQQAEQMRNRFEVEQAVINKLMKDSESDSVEELRNKITKFRDLQERYRAVLEKKRRLVEELKLDQLEKEEAALRQKIKEMEEELRKFPPLSMGLTEMRQEIERLERAIRLTNPNSPLLKDAVSGAAGSEEGHAVPEVDGPAPPNAPHISGTRLIRDTSLRPRTAAEAYERLIQSGARFFERERGEILKHIFQRFNLYLQAFFGKRYSEARIDPDNTIALKDAASGRWIEFDHLSPGARDTCYLALQLTLLELATQKRHLPVILDNPASRLDETAALVLAKALKRLSERTQVILLSAQRGPIQFADHSMELS